MFGGEQTRIPPEGQTARPSPSRWLVGRYHQKGTLMATQLRSDRIARHVEAQKSLDVRLRQYRPGSGQAQPKQTTAPATP